MTQTTITTTTTLRSLARRRRGTTTANADSARHMELSGSGELTAPHLTECEHANFNIIRTI